MKVILSALLAFLFYLPLMGADKKPLTKEESAKVIEAAIRKSLRKLTKVDLDKVRALVITGQELTSVKGLENLTQLKLLFLTNNRDLTKAQIDQLQKALPNCRVFHNAKK